MNINLSQNSFCFSVTPRRLSIHRRLFRSRGLAIPQAYEMIRLQKATRNKEPLAYSEIAINFMECLLTAYRKKLPYVILYEDDATPCQRPQEKLDVFLKENPLPPDCGILALGDLNGVSCVRGKETLLLSECSETYTLLVPGKAENKGSHALVVFHEAMLPYVQAITECGVVDIAPSRICRYGNKKAYGLFYNPIFLQHRFGRPNDKKTPYRTPELYAGKPEKTVEKFPLCKEMTRLYLKKPAKRFFVFSNAPGKDVSSLDITSDDIVVLLNHAVDFDSLPHARKLFIGRKNADKSNDWFIPEGQQNRLSQLYEDFLLPLDAEFADERPWYNEYRKATGRIPSTGWLAWKLLREDFPDAEVILVDFNPAGDIGTYKWPQHGWAYEAKDYAQNGAKIISLSKGDGKKAAYVLPSEPEAAPSKCKLLLAICSCVKNKALRQACRETWLSLLPPGVDYRFFVSSETPLPDESDVVHLPGVSDTYIGLPEKMMAAIEWAHSNLQWDYLGKVDDDTYLRVDRLLPMLTPEVHLLGRSRAGKRCPGGAGYFMSREAATALLEHKMEIPPEGDEDGLITRKLVSLGYTITDCSNLKQWSSEGFPANDNNLVSGHQLKNPALLHSCHDKNLRDGF